MRYFLKQCGFQELGSVGDDGRPKRGRYLLISMNQDVLDLFPPLSKSILNDCAVLPIVSLLTGKKTYCNYVYHNDKYNGSTAKHKRNEYRIYLNQELEDHTLLFGSEDILIMRQHVVDVDSNGTSQTIYYLDLLQDHSVGDYIRLSRYIDSSPIKGSYALFDGDLPFFENKVKALEAAQYDDEIVIDKSVTDRINSSSDETKSSLFNVATFRDFVLAGYGNACAITGKSVDNIFGHDIDVVYIKPRSAGGTCFPNNGIALAKSISMLFVEGQFTLTNDLEVKVHPKCKDENLLCLDGKQIRIPPNSFFQPSRESLKYHREHIWGSFLAQKGRAE